MAQELTAQRLEKFVRGLENSALDINIDEVSEKEVNSKTYQADATTKLRQLLRSRPDPE